MRILHIEHGGLPDLRIEKYALTMKKQGHELVFLGGRKSQYQNLGAFDRFYHIPLGNDLELALSPFLKRKWLQKISKINPDIIHAHNVLVAHYLLGTDYPAIYDDHEVWSKQTFKYKERKMPRGLASRPLVFQIPRWEKALVRKYPVLTTTENGAIKHRKIGGRVGVVRNVPLLQQVESLPVIERKGNLVYLGCDFKRKKFHAHRNMAGLRKKLDFNIICGLKHREMMEELAKYRIGLTPWKSHPWHPFSDANRNYEYLHAGLQVIVNGSIKQIFRDDPYVHSFLNYDTIRDVIEDLHAVEPSIIMKHACAKYLWEKQEKTIYEAYKIA